MTESPYICRSFTILNKKTIHHQYMIPVNQSFNIDTFLSKDFSEEFSRFSPIDAQKSLHAFYYDFSIQDWHKEESIPTQAFISFSHDNGELSPDHQLALISYLARLSWDEQTILNVIIVYLKSTYFQNVVSKEIADGNEDIEELLAKELLNNYIKGQIPDQIYKALFSTLILFCTEFDVSDGKIDSESFLKVIDGYATFEKY